MHKYGLPRSLEEAFLEKMLSEELVDQAIEGKRGDSDEMAAQGHPGFPVDPKI